MRMCDGIKERLCKPTRIFHNKRRLPILAIKISEGKSPDYAVFEYYPENYVGRDKEYVEELIDSLIEDFENVGYSLYDKSELDAKIESLLGQNLNDGVKCVEILDHVKGVFENVQVKCVVHVSPV